MSSRHLSDTEIVSYIEAVTIEASVTMSSKMSVDQKAILYLVKQVSDMQGQIDALLSRKIVMVPDRVNRDVLLMLGKAMDKIDSYEERS